MERIKNKRKRYLVSKKIQMQFAWLLVLQAAVPIIILGGALYIVNKTYLLAIQRVAGASVLSEVDIRSTLSFSMWSVAALLAITVTLLVFIGIRFSHGVAGPIYKLEKSMDRLAKGEKVERIAFRKADIITGLADKFNTIAEKLNQTI